MSLEDIVLAKSYEELESDYKELLSQRADWEKMAQEAISAADQRGKHSNERVLELESYQDPLLKTILVAVECLEDGKIPPDLHDLATQITRMVTHYRRLVRDNKALIGQLPADEGHVLLEKHELALENFYLKSLLDYLKKDMAYIQHERARLFENLVEAWNKANKAERTLEAAQTQFTLEAGESTGNFALDVAIGAVSDSGDSGIPERTTVEMFGVNKCIPLPPERIKELEDFIYQVTGFHINYKDWSK